MSPESWGVISGLVSAIGVAIITHYFPYKGKKLEAEVKKLEEEVKQEHEDIANDAQIRGELWKRVHDLESAITAIGLRHEMCQRDLAKLDKRYGILEARYEGLKTDFEEYKKAHGDA